MEVNGFIPYLCNRQFSQTLNLFLMLHSTTQERKKAQMASALFNDVKFFDFDCIRSTADWDELTCDEQMRLEDLVGSDYDDDACYDEMLSWQAERERELAWQLMDMELDGE